MKRHLLAALAALAALALPASAAQTGHAVYRPGLTQARIPLYERMGYLSVYTSYPRLASNLLERASSLWLDRTLDIFKAGGATNEQGATDWNDEAINPISGKTWPWLLEEDHGVFAYEGELWVEKDTKYYFYGRAANGVALVVDGETVVHQGKRSAYNYAPEVRKFWTAPKTGWVPFNAWMWSYDKSTGDQNSQWGFQYNVADFPLENLGEETASYSPPPNMQGIRHYSYNTDPRSEFRTNIWHRFVDPGNGTFFRTTVATNFTTVGTSTFAPDGGSASFDLSFADVPINAQLVAFTGPVDGFHDSNDWAHAEVLIPDVPAGSLDANVTVHLDSDARVLRFRLAHFDVASTTGLDVFEEWTEMFPVTDTPVVRLETASPGYSNVVVAGSVDSFGIGGGEATVTVEVFAGDDAQLSNPVASVSLPAMDAVGAFFAEVFGLETNTAYRVRARVVNDSPEPKTGHSAAIPFSTRDPGSPSASVAATVCAFDYATLTATVSDWGGGAWSAEAWIDVSTNENFSSESAGATRTFALGTLSGDLPATGSATATGLTPDTNYYARVRAVNSRGRETVSDTISFRTDSVPIAFPEPTVVSGKGHVSVSLTPTFVTGGTTYDVELYVDWGGFHGRRGQWKDQEEVATFAWDHDIPAGATATFTYTNVWTHAASGLSGRIVVSATTAAKIADYEIGSLPAIDPMNGGDYLRVGQTVGITPTTGCRIDWHTNAVLLVTETNGTFVVEAREPGAALLYETDIGTGNTNNVTGVAIVLPTNAPPGGIYVHRKEKEADWSWNDPEEWEMVSPGPKDYPDAPGAMVYIATKAFGKDDGDYFIEVTEPVTIGSLAVGQLGWIHHTKSLKSHWAWIFSDFDGLGGEIHFDSGDGSESRILTLGHAYNVSRVQFQVPVFSTCNDLTVDELWREQDTLGWKNTWNLGLSFEQTLDLGTNTLRNIRGYLYRYAPTKIWSSFEGNGCAARGFLQFYGDILGSGTIRLEADSMVGCVQRGKSRDLSFTGTWDVANGQNVSCYGGSGFTWPGTSLGRSKEMIIRGSWLRADLFWPGGAFARSADEGDNWHMFKGWTNDWQSLPRNLTLDGGSLYLHPNYLDAGWTQYNDDPEKKRRILYDVDTLEIPCGPMGFLSLKKSSSSLRYPDQYMTVTNLAMAPGAVLALELSDSTSTISNELHIVNAPGVWTDPDDENKQFLPYLFANQQLVNNKQYRDKDPYIIPGTVVDNTYLIFRDKERRVTRGTPENSGNKFRRWATGQGEELSNGSYYSMQLGQNVTNSFAAGATVTNRAGYLDMRKGAFLGLPGQDAGATLDFGNQPARIYVGNWGETGTIGCKLTGSAGLVKGGSGILALAAVAEGVKGGVRVAGGTLALGAANGEGRLCPSRVAGDVTVEAGSLLSVRNGNAFALGSRLLLNDRDWIPSYAHVRLEANAEVARLLLSGEPMPNGYYGSSEAALVHRDIIVDDDHFEGPGVLWAGVRPTLMILR